MSYCHLILLTTAHGKLAVNQAARALVWYTATRQTEREIVNLSCIMSIVIIVVPSSRFWRVEPRSAISASVRYHLSARVFSRARWSHHLPRSLVSIPKLIFFPPQKFSRFRGVVPVRAVSLSVPCLSPTRVPPVIFFLLSVDSALSPFVDFSRQFRSPSTLVRFHHGARLALRTVTSFADTVHFRK